MSSSQLSIGGRSTVLSMSSLGFAAAAVALLRLSAKVAVPFYPVPLSLQTLVVTGLGFAFGPKRAVAAVLAYLALGATGLPVFAGTPAHGIGLPYMVGPTGGFLAGYVLQAFVAGILAERGWCARLPTACAAAIVAMLAVYPTGLLWLGAVIGFNKPVLALGLTPFILGDVLKACLAALACTAARALPTTRWAA